MEWGGAVLEAEGLWGMGSRSQEPAWLLPRVAANRPDPPADSLLCASPR